MAVTVLKFTPLTAVAAPIVSNVSFFFSSIPQPL
jgi:hypothetical protein